MTVPLIVAPFDVSAAEIAASMRERKAQKKNQRNPKSKLLTRKDLDAEIRRLVSEEGLGIRAASARVGLSVTTVRHSCRTLGIGPYAGLKPGERRSKSSQVPFGWERLSGVLVPEKTEQKWIQRMRLWKAQGVGLRDIAWRLEKAGVKTKNGKLRWHAKTVAQILETLLVERR